jgi:hypothetical protein
MDILPNTDVEVEGGADVLGVQIEGQAVAPEGGSGTIGTEINKSSHSIATEG